MSRKTPIYCILLIIQAEWRLGFSIFADVIFKNIVTFAKIIKQLWL